ncbi:MAG: LPS assembly protein LptD [bacterium]
MRLRPLRSAPLSAAALALLLGVLSPAAEAQFAPPAAPARPAPAPGAKEAPKKTPGRRSEGLRFLRDPTASAAISADNLREDRERQRIIGSGFADLRYLGKRIQADHIEVQTETRDGIATGNVIFQAGNDRLVGSRIEFNLDSERMVIFDARGYIGATYYLTAQAIRRVSEDRYEITGGVFTTCDGDLPTWSFKAQKVRLQVEGYALLQFPVMKIRDLPVLPLPFMILPVKTKRATGLLPLRYALSNRNGTILSPEFFWAINDWSDATLGVDHFTRRGTRFNGEYRYALSQFTHGRIRGRWLRDKLEGATFWDLQAVHVSSWTGIGSLVAVVDETKRDKLDRSLETSLDERVRTNTDTSVLFSRGLLGGTFQAGLRRQEGLREKDGQLFQKLPEINFSVIQKRLGDSDFYYSQTSSFVNFRRVLSDNTTNLMRADFVPSINLRLATVPWLGVTPRVAFHETLWTDRKRDETVGGNPARDQQVDSILTREMIETGLSVAGPRFSRVYSAEAGPFRDFKHIVSLSGAYSYIPVMDTKDRRLIIPIDGVDSLQDSNVVSYGVNNRVLTKLRRGEGFETRQLISIDLTQRYDIAEARRTQNRQTERRPFSDILLTAQSRPISLLRLSHQTRYNVYEGEVASHTTGLRLDGGKNWFFDIDRTWGRQRNSFPFSGGSSFVNLSGGYAITPHWFAEFFTRINKVESVTLEQSLILRYQGCCWGFSITFTDTPDESEIMFSFSLRGVLEGEGAPTFRRQRDVAESGRFLRGKSLSPYRFRAPSGGGS